MTTENPEKYFYATGRRKTSVARVRLTQGSGKYLLDGKEIAMPKIVKDALKLVGKDASIDVSAKVSGGGKTGQAEAIRHGVSRALLVLNPEFRPTLKKVGYLTRDQREVERKKPGLRKARRAPQWSKR